MGCARRSGTGVEQIGVDERTNGAAGGKLVKDDFVTAASSSELAVFCHTEGENWAYFIGQSAPCDGLCSVNVAGSALLDPEFQERELVGREVRGIHFVIRRRHERFFGVSRNIE